MRLIPSLIDLPDVVRIGTCAEFALSDTAAILPEGLIDLAHSSLDFFSGGIGEQVLPVNFTSEGNFSTKLLHAVRHIHEVHVKVMAVSVILYITNICSVNFFSLYVTQRLKIADGYLALAKGTNVKILCEKQMISTEVLNNICRFQAELGKTYEIIME